MSESEDNCLDRNFIGSSETLREDLATIHREDINFDSTKPQNINAEEMKYTEYNYNASYHKGFQHEHDTGHLTNSHDYVQFRNAILSNDLSELLSTEMATNFSAKQVDPLSSLSTLLIGTYQSSLYINPPPKLSSKASASEMVELYCQAITRDVYFDDYTTNTTINEIVKIDGYMNRSDILGNLPDYSPRGTLTTKTLFRGIGVGEQVGPYISQLLLLNVPMGSATFNQKYRCYPSKNQCLADGDVNEWGRNKNGMVYMHNTTIDTHPPVPTTTTVYVHNGRSLAETVHNDPIYQFYYQAGLILASLGVGSNPHWPTYNNMNFFPTGSGGGGWQSAISHVANEALKHAWYWKWQIYRRLRPEVYSLWIHNIKNNLVPNKDNYDISDIVLNNPVMTTNKNYNEQWPNVAFKNSYTLSTTYREGSPTHPAYPSGHATIAGACCTLLKIFFHCEQPWSSVNMNNTRINPISPIQYVQSDSTGNNLIEYTDSDRSQMTIAGELNKLASNIAIGRNWAGIHYRTDAIQGILLGEQVAIAYVKDLLNSQVHNNIDQTPPQIIITSYTGKSITIKPTTCN